MRARGNDDVSRGRTTHTACDDVWGHTQDVWGQDQTHRMRGWVGAHTGCVGAGPDTQDVRMGGGTHRMCGGRTRHTGCEDGWGQGHTHRM